MPTIPMLCHLMTGTGMRAPHWGHLTFLPANSSLTLKLFAHPEHLKSITSKAVAFVQGFRKSSRTTTDNPVMLRKPASLVTKSEAPACWAAAA